MVEAKRALKNITTQVVMRIATTAGRTWVQPTHPPVTNTLKNLEEHFMKRLSALLISIITSSTCLAQTNNWNNSPSNWDNSPSNWNNSSSNWQNSPSNWQNSQSNWNSTNGVYDNSGNRIGYETQSPTGVTNVFDNNGNRIGYSPSKRQWLLKWSSIPRSFWRYWND